MPIVIDDLLRRVVERNASDLHLKVGSPPVIRVDGELERLDEFEPLKTTDTEALAAELFTARAARDFKAAGQADFAYGKPDLGRFRVAAFRQRGSISMVMRRVVPGSPDFEELGLPTAVRKLIENETPGIVLVTGPSGSGKTTTVASMVDWINENRAISIVTIEDPIEVLHPDKKAVVAQREIGVDTLDYASAVKAAMRQDADVIVLSEIGDQETARAAITAAETGHLVISTMRTSDPAETITRLVGYFPTSQHQMVRSQLAGLLKGIVSQRLLESINGSGLVLATEVLVNNERVQEWIMSEQPTATLQELIRESEFFGMQTFDQSILRLVLSRHVDIDTALPHVRNGHQLRAKAMEAGLLS
ncbi:MAG: PilT/PilU family type 4a pilus ATPase [Actinomycetes bacterium]|jgi:twitching motility protein PilT|nr:PilT/PilU family type 4a pilus ATPase [Acidimicrobiia bacterium]